MPQIVVYTCILNDWDYLREVPAANEAAADHLCFADAVIRCPRPWRLMPAHLPFQDPARNSRLPKMLPHLHFQADYSIWHDANFVLKQTPGYLIDRYLGNRDVAMFRHPCRTNVEQEAAVLLKEKIGDPLLVQAQLGRWRSSYYTEGLWCGGLIIRRHTPHVADFNRSWFDHFMVGSTRDQLALPMAKADAGMEISTIDGDIYSNDLMAFHWHAAWKDKPENVVLEALSHPWRDRRRRLVSVTKDFGQ